MLLMCQWLDWDFRFLDGSCANFLALFHIEARCVGTGGFCLRILFPTNLFILSPTDRWNRGGLFGVMNTIFGRHFPYQSHYPRDETEQGFECEGLEVALSRNIQKPEPRGQLSGVCWKDTVRGLAFWHILTSARLTPPFSTPLHSCCHPLHSEVMKTSSTSWRCFPASVVKPNYA